MKKQNYLVTFKKGWNTVYATNQAEAEKMAKAQFSQHDILRVKLISEEDLRLLKTIETMKNIKAITGKRVPKKAQIQNAMTRFREELGYTDEIKAFQVGSVQEGGQQSLYVHQFEIKNLMVACDQAGCLATIHGVVDREIVTHFPESAAVGTWFKITVH